MAAAAAETEPRVSVAEALHRERLAQLEAEEERQLLAAIEASLLEHQQAGGPPSPSPAPEPERAPESAPETAPQSCPLKVTAPITALRLGQLGLVRPPLAVTAS